MGNYMGCPEIEIISAFPYGCFSSLGASCWGSLDLTFLFQHAKALVYELIAEKEMQVSGMTGM